MTDILSKEQLDHLRQDPKCHVSTKRWLATLDFFHGRHALGDEATRLAIDDLLYVETVEKRLNDGGRITTAHTRALVAMVRVHANALLTAIKVIHDACEADPHMQAKCIYPSCGCEARGDWPPGSNLPKDSSRG